MAETADDLFSDKDLTLADPSEAVDIVLTEGGVDITEPGVYRLSGQVADGSIRVAPATEGDVWLLLDGVSVHNEDGAGADLRRLRQADSDPGGRAASIPSRRVRPRPPRRITTRPSMCATT